MGQDQEGSISRENDAGKEQKEEVANDCQMRKKKRKEKLPKPDFVPLAHPKGVYLECVCCELPATYMCERCKMSYYCSIEHKDLDMKHLHPHLCDIISYIKAPEPFFPVRLEREAYRRKRLNKTQELVEVCFQRAKKSLAENEPDAAILQCSYAHRYASRLYAPTDIRNIPMFLIFAQADAAKNDLHHARQFINKAEFLMKNDPTCPLNTVADFYQTKGLVDTFGNDLNSALVSFSEEIYCAAEAFHTEHTRVATGYYHLATIFILKGDKSTALSLFMHTVDIWCSRLSDLFNDMVTAQENPKSLLAKDSDSVPLLSIQESLDGSNTLESIFHEMTQKPTCAIVPSDDVTKTCYTLAILYALVNKYKKGHKFVEKLCSYVKVADHGFQKSESQFSEWVDRVKIVRKVYQRQLVKV